MLVLLLPLLVAQVPPSHCQGGERVVFTCAVKKKLLSVCAGPDWLQYRFGRPGTPELVYPPEKALSLGRFRFEERTLISGTSQVLSFANQGTRYEVYSQDGRDAGGGVLVSTGAGRPTTIACSGAFQERWGEVSGALQGGDVEAAAAAERCRLAGIGYADRALKGAQGQMDGAQQGALYETVVGLCTGGWSPAGAACVAKQQWPCPGLTVEQVRALETKHQEIFPR